MHIAKFIYIILGVTLVAVIPQLMQPTTSIWLVPRSTYCFASLYGILLLYLNLNFDFKTIGKIALVAVTIMFLLIQLVKFIKIERDRYTLNKEDLKIANYIVQQIKQYENKTGNKVEYIEIYQDLNPQYTYSGIFATGDMNVKCFSSDWSTESILEYYLKRDLKIANVNKERVNKDWNKFDFEQIQFKDNTLILVNY